jgi:RHS repeat-associated protein
LRKVRHVREATQTRDYNGIFGGDDGTGGYAPIGVATAPLGGTAALYWVHSNHLGVPLATTDAGGNAVTPGGYTQLAYPGQMKTLPDLWYNRHRDFDPSTGRYVQADPIGLAGGDNPYSYADGNALKYVDPSGECPWCIGIVVGAAIEVGIQAYENYESGKDVTNPDCYNWRDVGVAGAVGAFGGGVFKPALRLTRGSRKFANVSRRIRRAENLVGKKIDLHHGILPRSLERFGQGAQRIVNHPANLRAIPRDLHTTIHRNLNPITRVRGLPGWAQGAAGSVAIGSSAEALDGE